jgi:Spy/CpxP family protein refolding chaperone
MRFRKTAAVNLIVMGLFFSPLAAAEWHPAQEATPAPRQPGGGLSDRMGRDLDLTKDQQEKLQAIYQERDRKLKVLYDDFRARREAVKSETDAKFQALLTAEQREKLKAVERKKTAETAKSLERKGLKTN